MRRAIVLMLALVSFDCRCRTKYAPGEVTKDCNDIGARAYFDHRLDGGADDPQMPKRVCEQCCVDHGYTGVDPGPCECGELGLDVLMK